MRLRSVSAIVATLLIASTACGRAAQSNSADQNKAAVQPSTTIAAKASGTVTVWAMGNEGQQLTGFVKSFEQANPGVTVNVTDIPWDSAMQKFQTAIASGDVPDVAQMPGLPVFKTAYTPVPSAFDTSGMFQGAVKTGTMGGQLLEVPWYVDVRVLYYRTDLAKKAGWSSAPKTWDQLQQMAADMQSKAGAKWGIRLPAGKSGSFLNTLWMPWSNGEELMNSDESKWTLDTPQMAGAYQYLKSYFDKHIADPNADPAPAAEVHDFVTGSTPIVIDGPYLRSLLATAGGKGFDSKFATAVLPAKVSSTSFVGGSNLVVFNKAKNSAGGWKLVQWLTQPDTQVSWFQKTGDLPAVQKAWDDPALAGEPQLQAFGEQLKTAKSPPQLVSFDKVGAAADTAIEQIVKGSKSIPDALKALQQQADSIGTS